MTRECSRFTIRSFTKVQSWRLITFSERVWLSVMSGEGQNTRRGRQPAFIYSSTTPPLPRLVTVTISRKGALIGATLITLAFVAGFYAGYSRAQIRVVATDPYGNSANGIVKYCTLEYVSNPGDPYRRYLSFIPGVPAFDQSATYAIYSCNIS